MSDRKPAKFLSDEEKYEIYKYAIENRCLFQNNENFEYRVSATQIARELCTLGKVTNITSHHVQESIKKVINWQKILDKLPAVPQETVELDQLKIKNTRAVREIEELKAKIENLEKNLSKQNNDASEKLKRIKAIISA